MVVRKKRGVILIEDEGPLDLAREEERDAEGGITGLEARWLESVDLATRAGYLRAKGRLLDRPTWHCDGSTPSLSPFRMP